jgi:Icc-related predicted phosphoesterase
VRIVAISDTHTRHSNLILPEGDMLVHCGDYSLQGLYDEAYEYIVWLGKQTQFKHIVCISGNHDFNDTELKRLIAESGYNINYLLHEPLEIDGIKFFGSPYTPIFYNWHFMRYEDELARLYEEIPEDTQVLITHGPPYSILDTTQEGDFAGSVALYDRIKQLPQLKYHLFGHIHECYGRCQIDDITFINCSSVNRKYKPVNPPQVFDICP